MFLFIIIHSFLMSVLHTGVVLGVEEKCSSHCKPSVDGSCVVETATLNNEVTVPGDGAMMRILDNDGENAPEAFSILLRDDNVDFRLQVTFELRGDTYELLHKDEVIGDFKFSTGHWYKVKLGNGINELSLSDIKTCEVTKMTFIMNATGKASNNITFRVHNKDRGVDVLSSCEKGCKQIKTSSSRREFYRPSPLQTTQNIWAWAKNNDTEMQIRITYKNSETKTSESKSINFTLNNKPQWTRYTISVSEDTTTKTISLFTEDRHTPTDKISNIPYNSTPMTFEFKSTNVALWTTPCDEPKYCTEKEFLWGKWWEIIIGPAIMLFIVLLVVFTILFRKQNARCRNDTESERSKGWSGHIMQAGLFVNPDGLPVAQEQNTSTHRAASARTSGESANNLSASSPTEMRPPSFLAPSFEEHISKSRGSSTRNNNSADIEEEAEDYDHLLFYSSRNYGDDETCHRTSTSLKKLKQGNDLPRRELYETDTDQSSFYCQPERKKHNALKRSDSYLAEKPRFCIPEHDISHPGTKQGQCVRTLPAKPRPPHFKIEQMVLFVPQNRGQSLPKNRLGNVSYPLVLLSSSHTNLQNHNESKFQHDITYDYASVQDQVTQYSPESPIYEEL